MMRDLSRASGYRVDALRCTNSERVLLLCGEGHMAVLPLRPTDQQI